MAARRGSISSDVEVHDALREHGWDGSAEPEVWLEQFAQRKVASLLRDAVRAGHSSPKLDEVPRIVADRLGVTLLEVTTDEELAARVDEYATNKELAFTTLDDEFASGVEAAIIRLRQPRSWERPLVAVIDARGERRWSKYFSAAHEISHPLLQPQMSFNFRCRADGQKPLERSVDMMAGELAFHRPIAEPLLRKAVGAQLTVSGIDSFRTSHAPLASRRATLEAAIRIWDGPAVLVVAESRCAKHGRDGGVPALRVSSASANRLARTNGLQIPKNFRVPEGSTLYRAYHDRGEHSGFEDLGWWRSSDGSRLLSWPYCASAVRIGHRLYGVLCFSKR